MDFLKSAIFLVAVCWTAAPVATCACSADSSAAGVAATIGDGATGVDDRIKKMNTFAVKSHALMRQNLLGMNVSLPRQ